MLALASLFHFERVDTCHSESVEQEAPSETRYQARKDLTSTPFGLAFCTCCSSTYLWILALMDVFGESSLDL